MKRNSGTPTGSRDTATTVLDNRSSSKEKGRNAGESPVPNTSADRIKGDYMQPTAGNNEMAGGRREDPKGGAAGERRGKGEERHDTPSPASEKDGPSKAKMVISTNAGGEPHKDVSPTNKGRNSKKRSREESANPLQERLDVDEDLQRTGELSTGTRSLSGSADAADEGEATKAPAAAAAAEARLGDDGAAAGEEGTAAAKEAFLRPGVPKPLEDPLVKEVVLQDLATQEIRRVRRKQNDPPSAVSGQTGAGTAKLPEGQRDAVSGDAGVDTKSASPALASAPANGATPVAARANGKAELHREGERLGAAGKSREKDQAAAEGEGGVGDVHGKGRAGTTPDAAEASDEKSNGVAVQPVERSTDSAALPEPMATPAAEPVAPSSVSGKDSEASLTTVTTTRKPAVSSPKALQGIETASDNRVGDARSAEPGAGGGAELNAEPEPMDEDGRGSGERKDGGSVRGNDKGQAGEEEKEGKGPAKGSSASMARSVQCPAHVLPVARTFFDYDSVSSFEMRMLPEFFTGRSASKTPEMYMQARNYMVRSYQRMLDVGKDGHAYLTGTECRRKLAGDACSTIRIHDFLDRFGLINTRTGGKRPLSYTVPPPAVHLWHPTPAAAPSSRETTATTSTFERKLKRQEASGGGGRGGVVGGWGQDSALAQRGASSSGDQAWRREELTRLMEAAVANPDEWDVVAQRVGGGRTPSACMRHFLSLAVEELFVEDKEEESSRPSSATETSEAPAAMGVAPPATLVREAGPTGDAVVAGVGVDASPSLSLDTTSGTPMSVDAPTARGEDLPSSPKPSSTKPAVAGDISTDADKGAHRSRGDSEWKRPAYLGPQAPALMLASALVSSVHPEVLEAAMSAAVAAADDVARRSAAAAVTLRAPGGDTGDRLGVRLGGGGYSPSDTGARRRRDGAEGVKDDDIEMRDVVGKAGGEGDERIKKAGVGAAVSPGRRETGEAVEEEEGVEVERQAVRAGAARAAVLSVAGLQARGLAELEERQTEALVSDLVEARVQRLEIKLHCLDELDKVLETERLSLEHDRAELLAHHARSMFS